MNSIVTEAGKDIAVTTGIKRYLISQFGHPRGPLGALAGRLMAYKNRARIAWAVEQLAPRPEDRVLEIGFGPGLGIALLADRASQVCGVDVSRTMLRQALARNRRAVKEDRVDLRRGSVDDLPWPDGHFHRALAVNSHLFWPDLDRGLAELRRVLDPEGVLAIAFQPPTAQGQRRVDASAAALADAVQRAGFPSVTTRVEPLDRGLTIWLKTAGATAGHPGENPP